MRIIGAVLIAVSIALGVLGWTYEVGITIEGDTMRRGTDVRPLPEALRRLPPELRASASSVSMLNLGLLAHQQAIFLAAAVSMLSGVLLIGFGQVVATLKGAPQEATSPVQVDENSIRNALLKFARGALSDRGEFTRLARNAGRYGLDLETRESGTGATLLHIAAGLGDIDAVRSLLAAGANPSSVDAQGRKPFDMARDTEVRHLLTSDSVTSDAGVRRS